jgi:hypothetical protein
MCGIGRASVVAVPAPVFDHPMVAGQIFRGYKQLDRTWLLPAHEQVADRDDRSAMTPAWAVRRVKIQDQAPQDRRTIHRRSARLRVSGAVFLSRLGFAGEGWPQYAVG